MKIRGGAPGVVPAYPLRVVQFLMLFFCLISLNPFWKVLRLGFFWRFIFVPGIFWVLLEALGIFFGFDFCPHSIIPSTWCTPLGNAIPLFQLNSYRDRSLFCRIEQLKALLEESTTSESNPEESSGDSQ